MKALAIFLLALTAACAPQTAQQAVAQPPEQAVQPGYHSISGLEVVPLTITNQDGTVHHFRVEVARSGQEQAKGLMFRKEMGADEGMIFPRNPPDIASFWMRNTVLSLDMIFVGTDGRILNIEANTVPYTLDSHRSQGIASAVLELNGGRAAELGIEPGAKVEW